MGNNSKKASLKTKLLILSFGITALLGCASFVIVNNLVQHQKKFQLDNFEGIAESLSASVAAQFFERYGDVQAFAINPSVRSNSKQTIIDALNNYAALYLIYDLILVVDKNGRLIAVNSKDPSGKEIDTKPLYEKNYSNEGWFTNTLQGKFTEDKEKGFAGTYFEDMHADPYVSIVYKKEEPYTSFNAQIKNDKGDVIGVISNRANSAWVRAAFVDANRIIKALNYKESDMYVVRKDGMLLSENHLRDGKEAKLESKELKINLLQEKDPATIAAVAGNKGSLVAIDPMDKNEDASGYAAVTGPKFIDAIGWTVIVRDSLEEVMADVNRQKMMFYFAFTLITSLATIVAYFFSTTLAKHLTSLANSLAAGSEHVSSAATEISATSTRLSEAAVEQASAIQETAASIDEVSAMIKKSSENAKSSQTSSQASRGAAEEGQQAVRDVIDAIEQISGSNTNIMQQVEHGNTQIAEIVKVIAEIGNKTKVINDIVFQTKLLSFNASVEAARAGEHGKGFAVVAEEVGNLAQMSGNAAKEISSLLDGSIQKVDGIVKETKEKVEVLVAEGKTKLETGTDVAKRCGETLSKILVTVQEVDGMVAEISVASNEQSLGVSEINKAMNQLDEVTHQNTAVAQESASAAQSLNDQAHKLREMVLSLRVLIDGNSTPSPQNRTVKTAPKPIAKTTTQTKASPKVATKTNVVPIQEAKKAIEQKSISKETKTADGMALPSQDDPRFRDV